MVALDHTRALIASLAAVIGLPELPQDETGGYHLTIGGDGDVFIYGGDDISILVVVPVARLPEAPGYAVVNELLHGNMFNSDYMPFVAAVDDGGMVILWASSPSRISTGRRWPGRSTTSPTARRSSAATWERNKPLRPSPGRSGRAAGLASA